MGADLLNKGEPDEAENLKSDTAEAEKETAEPDRKEPIEPSESTEESKTEEKEKQASEEASAEAKTDEGPEAAGIMERKPYRKRHYLLYGGNEMPDCLDPEGTLSFLRKLGYENGSMQQAREKKSLSDKIAGSFMVREPGAHYCDFCGVELSGVEYDRLADGRERCPQCTRTAIRAVEEGEKLYRQVFEDMRNIFHIRFAAPIHVKIVNAKALHKSIKMSFVPTDAQDGRVLGVAIYDKKQKTYTILLENGTPRSSGARTIAHELTHIWQYLNWNAEEILKKYGPTANLEIYEGMAEWVGIQYLYLIGEMDAAKWAVAMNALRNDEYGRGFMRFLQEYPLTGRPGLSGKTPFMSVAEPLPL